MRYGVFTVILPEMDLDGILGALARNGYEGVEWRVREIPEKQRGKPVSFWGNVREDLTPARWTREAAAIARRAREAGLESFACAGYARCTDIETVKLLVAGCAEAGVPGLRVGPSGYDRTRDYNDLLAESVDGLGRCVEAAAGSGVRLLVETHMNTIVPSASAAHRLVSGFPPEDVGVILDPGNFVSEGRENYRMALEVLGPYLNHVHAKNARWIERERLADNTVTWKSETVPLWEGVVSWREVMADLVAFGFDGWVSIEDFSGLDAGEKLARDGAYLRAIEREVRERA